MKQIFTLVLATALSFTSAFAQTSQSFETLTVITGTSPLTNNCWTLTNIDFQAASSNSIGATKNLRTTDATATLRTPYVNLVEGNTISFDYKLTAGLNGGATRTITVSLLSSTGVLTSLGSPITVNSSTSTTTTFNFSAVAPVTDVRKVVLSFSGSNNSSIYFYIDNLYFGGELNYNSPYNCNSGSQSPLPVHLKSFQGLVNNDKAQLQWKVADNEAGNLFEIQKSSDAKEFKTIALVGTTQKTGDETYTYNDDLQTSAYYRLKLINKGSAAIYSDVLFIKKQGTAANAISLLQNPVKNTLKFTFTSDINSQTEISVYNLLGVKVYQSSFAASKGANTIAKTLDGQIKGGTYVLEIKNATNRSIAKFLKD